MSATWEGAWHYDPCSQAWVDMLWLRAALSQSQEHNTVAREGGSKQ